jgi:hypothetical protein
MWFITVFTTVRHLCLPLARLIQSKSSNCFFNIYLNIMLSKYVLFSTLRISHQNRTWISLLRMCHMPHPPPSPLIDHKNIWWGIKSRKSSLINHLQCRVIYCLLGESILPSTLLSNNLNTFSKFHNHTKPAILYVLCYILMRVFWESKRETKKQKTNVTVTVVTNWNLAHSKQLIPFKKISAHSEDRHTNIPCRQCVPDEMSAAFIAHFFL